LVNRARGDIRKGGEREEGKEEEIRSHIFITPRCCLGLGSTSLQPRIAETHLCQRRFSIYSANYSISELEKKIRIKEFE